VWAVPGSGRRPINSPGGPSGAAGVPWIGLGILLVLALILAAFVAYFFFDVGRESDDPAGSPGVAPLVTNGERPDGGLVTGHSDGSLGYPATATRNTTRISGSDPAEISIAAALAAYPTVGPGTPPSAVTVTSDSQWQAGVAAATLSAAPVHAPLILAPDGTLTEDAETVISEFEPQGAPITGENQVFAVGKVTPPPGYDTAKVNAPNPAALAVKVAELKAELTGGPPAAFVVVSSEDPEFAAPAATWAARSGDVVLYTDPESVPDATLDFLKKKANAEVPVFVLGPTGAVSADAVEQLGKVSESVERVGGGDPVAAALELVRFSSGTFGWNLNDPGHGYTVARADRPMDAIAATALSTGGTWPALLLTDSSDNLPEDVADYLLDVQPGYETDPTRAVFNHVWIIGDESLIDVNQQAVIDDAVELQPVEALSAP
jgi:putative cell wall-binding protein